MPKSWIEKLYPSRSDLPKTVELDDKQAARLQARTMLVPSPEMIFRIMRQVPRGKLITVSTIREFLAPLYGVDTVCPLTTGIFIWIAANASEEMESKGISPGRIPWWRTLKSGGELVSKYPGGLEMHRHRLTEEGFPVVCRGKKCRVQPLEPYLWDFEGVEI